MSDHDFMPMDGWDHLEIWVGNAKQSAYFYENAFGFTRTAYAGPETGVRDRASYVLEQGDIRLVLHERAARATARSAAGRPTKGDSVRDVALAVPDATNAYRQAVQRGARGVDEPHWVEDDHGRVELAAIGTYGDNIHTFVNRSEYTGPYLPGFQSRLAERRRRPEPAWGSSRSTTSSATSSSAGWTSGSASTSACSASRSSPTSPTRTSRPSTRRSCPRS